MPRYSTFSYSDNLPQRIHTQLPEALKVTGTRVGDPELLLIIRLLSGNLELTHNYSNKIIKNRINYFSSNFQCHTNWKRDFPKLLSEDTEAEDLATFINQTKYVNKAFYSRILAELSQFILHEKNGNHTSAFIYIYRALEKIAFAFPLIYSSKTQDFLRSFSQLKELMISDKENKELGFFKSFITTLYDGDDISLTSVDININASNEDVRKQMFKSLKSVSSPSVIHSDTLEFEKLSIKYCEMGSFIISVRNRFFHNSNSGQPNLESDKIVDSNELFSFINPAAMYWISMVFFGVFSYSLSEFQTHRRNAE